MLNRYLLALILTVVVGCGDSETAAEELAARDTVIEVPSTPRDVAPGEVVTGGIPLDGAAGPAYPAGPGSAPSGGDTPPTSQTGAPAPRPDGAAPPPAQQPAPTGTAANDILARAEARYADLRSMQAEFVQEVYVPLLEQTQNSRGTMFHLSPDRFLMRFSDPRGDIVLADGRYIWMYYPSTDDKQVMRAALSQSGQQVDLYKEFLSDATSRFSATRTGGEAIGGRQTHALTLVPRGPSPYSRVRIWVDTENSLVRRFEITEENGTVRRIQLSDIRPNAQVAESLFRFTPPAGVQVHDF